MLLALCRREEGKDDVAANREKKEQRSLREVVDAFFFCRGWGKSQTPVLTQYR